MSDPNPVVEAQRELDVLLASMRSLMLASSAEDGVPEASYAPFVRDEAGCLYVFVSGLSRRLGELSDQQGFRQGQQPVPLRRRRVGQ